MNDYGKELVLDLDKCDHTTFTRKSIKAFFIKLCSIIDMERGPIYWWDDLYTPEAEKETEPHLVGTSAVQFIKTSNITIHTLDLLDKVYLNIFSCKDFDTDIATSLSVAWFNGQVLSKSIIRRV